MSPLQAEPEWAPWAKVRPPGNHRHASPPGRAREEGPVDLCPVEGTLIPFMLLIIGSFDQHVFIHRMKQWLCCIKALVDDTKKYSITPST